MEAFLEEWEKGVFSLGEGFVEEALDEIMVRLCL